MGLLYYYQRNEKFYTKNWIREYCEYYCDSVQTECVDLSLLIFFFPTKMYFTNLQLFLYFYDIPQQNKTNIWTFSQQLCFI